MPAVCFSLDGHSRSREGEGGEMRGDVHSTALTKSGWYALLPRAGGVEGEGGDVQR